MLLTGWEIVRWGGVQWLLGDRLTQMVVTLRNLKYILRVDIYMLLPSSRRLIRRWCSMNGLACTGLNIGLKWLWIRAFSTLVMILMTGFFRRWVTYRRKRGGAGFQIGIVFPNLKGWMMRCQNVASFSKTKVKYKNKDREKKKFRKGLLFG